MFRDFSSLSFPVSLRSRFNLDYVSEVQGGAPGCLTLDQSEPRN